LIAGDSGVSTASPTRFLIYSVQIEVQEPVASSGNADLSGTLSGVGGTAIAIIPATAVGSGWKDFGEDGLLLDPGGPLTFSVPSGTVAFCIVDADIVL